MANLRMTATPSSGHTLLKIYFTVLMLVVLVLAFNSLFHLAPKGPRITAGDPTTKVIAYTPLDAVDSLTFCRDADQVYADDTPSPETVGPLRVAQKGMASLEWRDNPKSGLAILYYQETGGAQASRTVEITRDAAECMRKAR